MVRFCCFFLYGLLRAAQLTAQPPDSLQTNSLDSTALRAFRERIGPAEGVFSFGSTPAIRFRTGIYAPTDFDLPLRYSPDSTVCQPVERSFRQRRVAEVAGRATIIPLALLAYAGVRVVLSLTSVINGRPQQLDHLKIVFPLGAVGSLAGISVMGTFTIASQVNLRKALKRHNRQFNRTAPTLFNPKGL